MQPFFLSGDTPRRRSRSQIVKESELVGEKWANEAGVIIEPRGDIPFEKRKRIFASNRLKERAENALGRTIHDDEIIPESEIIEKLNLLE